jgi:hypothetical protein
MLFSKLPEVSTISFEFDFFCYFAILDKITGKLLQTSAYNDKFELIVQF